jgi:hypothetical protein
MKRLGLLLWLIASALLLLLCLALAYMSLMLGALAACGCAAKPGGALERWGIRISI